MTLQPKFNSQTYKNWVKASLALRYLKDGLETFVEHEVNHLHSDILARIGSATCNLCSVNNATRCPNNVCNRIRQALVANHAYSGPFWKNTDAAKWCTDPWELAKVFMSPGYEDKNTARDTDCSGLLSVCINGTFVRHAVTIDTANKTDLFHQVSRPT